MAFLHQLSEAEIHRNFTHYAWFSGLVPIYYNECGPDGDPMVTTRNWVPDWVLDLVAGLASLWLTLTDPDGEGPGYMFLITGEIK